jgi:ketosteroid isomerase-like protein
MITIDIEAEKKTIRKMVKNAFEVENHKNVDEIMDLGYYSEDCIAQIPNMPIVKGLEGARDFYKEYFKILESIEGGSIEIFISEAGDMAWDYGWNRTVLKGPNGTILDEGKYLEIFQKIDGKWKCVAISASSDKPAT